MIILNTIIIKLQDYTTNSNFLLTILRKKIVISLVFSLRKIGTKLNCVGMYVMFMQYMQLSDEGNINFYAEIGKKYRCVLGGS